MPDAQQPAAAAPVTSAAPSTPETPAAPAAETPAKPAVKLKGRAAHDAIRAKLTAAKAAPAGDKPADDASNAPAAGDLPAPAAAKTQPAPTEPSEEKKPAVGAVMRLTAENTKLKGQLEELQAKHEVASKAETIEAFRERVKADPAVIFDVFGADLGEDGEKQWERLVDAVRDRADPSSAADRKALSEVEALKKQLADRDAEAAKRAEDDRAQKRRAHTAQILTEGFKDEIGETIVDSAKYPYVNHLTKVGEVDVHAGISATVLDLVVEFQKSQKRQPSDAEIAKFIAISAEQAEQHFAKRAKNWQLPQAAAPAPATTETPERPTTIGSQLGGRDAGGVDTRKLSPREKHALIRERLRTANRASSPN
jgi:regulator of replication initiation timing